MDWTSLFSWLGEHYLAVLAAIAALVGVLWVWRALRKERLRLKSEVLNKEDWLLLREVEQLRRAEQLARANARESEQQVKDLSPELEHVATEIRGQALAVEEVAKSTDEARLARELASVAGPKATSPDRALEIEAGLLVYRIAERMWRSVPEKVEVRLGRHDAQGIMDSLAGRGPVRTRTNP